MPCRRCHLSPPLPFLFLSVFPLLIPLVLFSFTVSPLQIPPPILRSGARSCLSRSWEIVALALFLPSPTDKITSGGAEDAASLDWQVAVGI